MAEIKEDSGNNVIEVVADKGYEAAQDMIDCLENGIIPHVITDDGDDGYELEIPYEESEVDVNSTNAEELNKCLHAGFIPEAYKDVIENIEVKEVRRKVKEEKSEVVNSPYGTPAEMLARAKEGYFVRDPERNLVYCPAGETLRQKCVKSNGYIRYANKTACRHCKYRNKCYKGQNEWKEVDFTKDNLEKPCRDWLKSEGKTPDKVGVTKGKCHYEKVKLVRFFLKPDITKTAQRMCLSEHPFGTIKRAMGATYFLLKGLVKVEGEFALLSLGYNIERAKNLLGFNKMMELMAGV
jgi:transposase